MPQFAPRDTMARMKPKERDNPYTAPQQCEITRPPSIQKWLLAALVVLFSLPFVAWCVLVASVLLSGLFGGG